MYLNNKILDLALLVVLICNARYFYENQNSSYAAR